MSTVTGANDLEQRQRFLHPIPPAVREWAEQSETSHPAAAGLMRLARTQEGVETFHQLVGQAQLNGLTETGVVVQARLCDCMDEAHPYGPEPGDLREFTWTADVDQVESVQVFQGGAVHVRYRRVALLVSPETGDRS